MGVCEQGASDVQPKLLDSTCRPGEAQSNAIGQECWQATAEERLLDSQIKHARQTVGQTSMGHIGLNILQNTQEQAEEVSNVPANSGWGLHPESTQRAMLGC